MKRVHPYYQINGVENFSFLANTAAGGATPSFVSVNAKPVPETTDHFGDVMMHYMDY